MSDPLDYGLPRAVAVTWGMAVDPQRGPKRELSHERIVEAAITIADAEGLAAVTMSKVATSLGFTTMSLYRYVSSKDELLQLMHDSVCGVPVPTASESQDWRSGLRAWAALTLGVYQDHRWFVELPVSQTQLMTPNNLMMADAALRAMRETSLTDPEKMGVLMLIGGYVRTFGLLEHDMGAETFTDAWAGPQHQAALKELITEDRFPYLYPLVQSGVYFGAGAGGGDSDGEDDFAFGLDRILDGLAVYMADRPAPQPQPEPDEDLTSALALEPIRRDKAVREASKLRREAEAKLREARKREREMIKKALERAKNEAEAAERRAR